MGYTRPRSPYPMIWPYGAPSPYWSDAIRISDMPDLGPVTDATSFVGEHAGSGRFLATALRDYMSGSFLPIDGSGALNGDLTVNGDVVANSLRTTGAIDAGGPISAVNQMTIAGAGGATLYLTDPNAAVDARTFGFASQGSHLYGLVMNEGLTFGNTWLAVNRTGYEVASVAIDAPVIDLNGDVSADSVMSTGGYFYFMNDTAYSFARQPGDGKWVVTEDGTPILVLDPTGALTIQGDLVTPTFLRANGGVSANPDATLVLQNRTTDRVLQFQTNWTLAWEVATGNLTWFMPGGAFTEWRISDHTFINWAGPVAGNGAYQNTSDERVKMNIAPAKRGLADILAIEPISFRRLGPNGAPLAATEVGFSAQQLETALPEAVRAIGRAPTPGGSHDEADPLKAIMVEPIVAALVNAVRSMAGDLAAAMGRIATLEAK
jgi:Chaperone of endosialidase